LSSARTVWSGSSRERSDAAQVNPHVLPFLRSTKSTSRFAWVHKAAMLVGTETLHRLRQLAEVGVWPRCVLDYQEVLVSPTSLPDHVAFPSCACSWGGVGWHQHAVLGANGDSAAARGGCHHSALPQLGDPLQGAEQPDTGADGVVFTPGRDGPISLHLGY
jgi:hypothetical protein